VQKEVEGKYTLADVSIEIEGVEAGDESPGKVRGLRGKVVVDGTAADVSVGSLILIFILSRLSIIFFSCATPYPLGFLNGTSGSPSIANSLFRLYGKGVSLPEVSSIFKKIYEYFKNCIRFVMTVVLARDILESDRLSSKGY
jgi:hypothetical protein